MKAMTKNNFLKVTKVLKIEKYNSNEANIKQIKKKYFQTEIAENKEKPL